MKRNINLILLIILIVLILSIIYIKNPFIIKKKVLIIPEINKEMVNKLEIKDFVIEKQGEDWIISSDNGILARKDYIDKILDYFKNVKIKEKISKNPKKFSKFKVDDKNGIRLKIYEQSALKINIIVGKIGPDYNSTYIRRENENIVYLISGKLVFYVDRDDFKDKRLLTINQDKVEEFSFKYKNGINFKVIKSDDKWKINNEIINSEKVEEFLLGISTIYANDVKVLSDDNITGLNNPELEFSIKLKNLPQITILIGNLNKQENIFYCANKSKKTMVYLVDKEIIKNDLMKKIKDFKK